MNQSPDIQAENARLRAENARLKKQKKGGMNGCLIAAIVVAAGSFLMIPIMAAVALPMYSVFKQKSKTSVVLRACTEAVPALSDYYDKHQVFEGADVSPEGGAIRLNGDNSGAGLPQMPDISWSTEAQGNVLVIRWNFSAGCPPDTCDGSFTIECNNGCETSAMVGDENDPLGLNF